MAFPKMDEIRDWDDARIAEEILAVKKQLFELRFRQATRQPVKPHEFRHARHRLAQLLTLEHERRRQAHGS
ncbi:MAG: 50S ribosomal protein L29 [Gloeomargarita sp. SKYG116]|nr:50S ribosomal protein L29 [Gloeomargarita sp. SKYG98]MCS7031711.1 50S ribosomal protein L29 [Gloeomargarita sp. SKYG116]MDW8401879.1 50S ribosomal protein L29 [Gloeomargarita sp. SKYGB_i_bin116]